MLEERIILKGNKEERVYQALRMAGWFPERRAEISHVLKYYEKWNIKLNLRVEAFIREYYGVASQWYIEVENLKHGADFMFQLFPYPKNFRIDVVDFMYDDADFLCESDEYKNVKA